jgi:epoxyqueuosine reductase
MTMPFDLQTFSEQFGWSLSGVASVEMSKEAKDKFRDWIQDKKGPQMHYLEKRLEERLDPRKYFSSAQSILCFGLYYFPGWAKGEVKISNYSWGEDYHRVLKEKLEETARALQKEFPQMEYRVCVDTSPIAEKYWALQAGLGWQGKNTLVLNTKIGSTFFLGEILCSLPPERFQKTPRMADHCGTCQRCLLACPTDALEPYVLDASRCISYWTLEHKGDFTEATPEFKSWVAGCDICQEVCPWNQKLIPLETDLRLQELSPEALNRADWLERIEGRAISYVKEANWERNLRWVSREPSNSS